LLYFYFYFLLFELSFGELRELQEMCRGE